MMIRWPRISTSQVVLGPLVARKSWCWTTRTIRSRLKSLKDQALSVLAPTMAHASLEENQATLPTSNSPNKLSKRSQYPRQLCSIDCRLRRNLRTQLPDSSKITCQEARPTRPCRRTISTCTRNWLGSRTTGLTREAQGRTWHWANRLTTSETATIRETDHSKLSVSRTLPSRSSRRCETIQVATNSTKTSCLKSLRSSKKTSTLWRKPLKDWRKMSRGTNRSYSCIRTWIQTIKM